MTIRTPRTGTPPDAMGAPAGHAVAVDLGSGYARLWASAWGRVDNPTAVRCVALPDRLVERGRVIDGPACAVVLNRLRRYQPPLPPRRPVVVVCRPVLATRADQDAVHRVVTTVFGPATVLFIDAVRAAAIGAGATTGDLLVVDIGTQLTEVAVLADGGLVAARRTNLGTRDLRHGVTPTAAARCIAGLVDDLRDDVDPEPTHAQPRRILVTGGGATLPTLTTRLAAALHAPVSCAPAPRIVAVRGAGTAALAACRHPTTAAA